MRRGGLPQRDLSLTSLTANKVVADTLSAGVVRYRRLEPPVFDTTSIAGSGTFELTQSGTVVVEDYQDKTLVLPDLSASSRQYAFRIIITRPVMPPVHEDFILRDAIVADDDFIYISGQFANVGSFLRRNIARINRNTGAVDPEWNPNVDDAVASISLDTKNGFLYAVGFFTMVNGNVPRNGAARFFLSGTGEVDSTWDPDLNNGGRIVAVDSVNGDIYIGGEFTTVNGGAVTRNRIARFPAQGAAVPESWDPNVNGRVWDIALDRDSGLAYVGGDFTTVNGGGLTRNRAARFSISTGTADGWDPDLNSGVRTVVLDLILQLAYVGGSFTTANGGAVTRNRIARFPTSVPATVDAWDLNANGIVEAVRVDQDRVIIGGTFTALKGSAVGRRRIARISSDVSADVDDWNPDLNDGVFSVLPPFSDGSVIAGGSFTELRNVQTFRLAPIATTNIRIVTADASQLLNGTLTSTRLYSSHVETAVSSIGKNWTIRQEPATYLLP